jgi:hypothetical protein
MDSTTREQRFLLPGIAALLAAAWLISRVGAYTSGSSAGYALGVGGGALLALLLLYPVRKRVRFMRSWGAMRGWFALHMACGIGAPVLILAHSKFQVGSINAAVALASLLLVAASGVVGRFIYVHIHEGLYGTRSTLAGLQAQLGLKSSEVQAWLRLAPAAVGELKAFEAASLARTGNPLRAAWVFATLGARARAAARRCARDFARAYRGHARAQGWDAARQRRDLAAAARLIGEYASAVRRLAQLGGYERLFSLWHVVHVPLVWMLVLSVVAHVVAVHAY